jgi:hypothetical protein
MGHGGIFPQTEIISVLIIIVFFRLSRRIAGASLDRENPWRDLVIGAALGALAGATREDVSAQKVRESAEMERLVEYGMRCQDQVKKGAGTDL